MLLLTCLLGEFAFAQKGFNGTFKGEINAVASILTLKTTENNVSGSYKEGDFNLNVVGIAKGTTASGTFRMQNGLKVADFTASMANDNTMDLTLQIMEQTQTLMLQRMGNASATQTARPSYRPQSTPPAPRINRASNSQARDPKIVGHWKHQDIISSRDAGFQTVLYFYLEGNGTYAQYSQSVGGGNLSFDSGKKLVQTGEWYTRQGVICLKPQGQSQFTAGTRYKVTQGRIVTQDVNGRKIWSRE